MSTKAPRAIMSPEQRAEANAALGFDEAPDLPNHAKLPPNPEAGSLAPLAGDRMPAAQLEALRSIEDKLRDTFDEWVKGHVRNVIKVGTLMNEAREQFLRTQDTEFGKWRSDFLGSIEVKIAPKTCNDWMHIAREYRNAPEFVEKIGMSVARELINASPAVQKQISSMLDAGEKPTVQEVREAKKESSSPPPASEPQRTSAESKPKPAKIVTQEEMARILLAIPDHDERVERATELVALSDYIRAYACIGLLAPNEGEEYPSWVTSTLYRQVLENVNQENADFLEEMYEENVE